MFIVCVVVCLLCVSDVCFEMCVMCVCVSVVVVVDVVIVIVVE